MPLHDYLGAVSRKVLQVDRAQLAVAASLTRFRLACAHAQGRRSVVRALWLHLVSPRAEPLAPPPVAAVLPVLREAEEVLPVASDVAALQRILTCEEPLRPRGIYIHGGVGRGKSFLLDLFFAQSETEHKFRLHYHSLMRRMHAGLAQRRPLRRQRKHHAPEYQNAENQSGEHHSRLDHKGKRRAHRQQRITAAVISDLFPPRSLLCIDELEITDITDAMLMDAMLLALSERECRLVLTSNTAPRDLYANGLAREQFMAAIAWFEDNLEVIHFGDGQDFRRAGGGRTRRSMGSWYEDASEFASCVAAEADLLEQEAPFELDSSGRHLRLEAQGTLKRDSRARLGHVCFASLCDQPVGASDYLQLCAHFSWICISQIWALSRQAPEVAARWRTCIDILYDQQVRVTFHARCSFAEHIADFAHHRPYARTISRLIEMAYRQSGTLDMVNPRGTQRDTQRGTAVL